ncbi:hypothetical protein MES4922_180127 [Mesorhizobium ventifaucium]|uniref:Uncharacterized protein n=1 Tax=Mesorhizobium ventifaucium TaxID=666020 RepID=A0ABM9DKR4_9HYPH|nr:hypothetical protein MES4922_180127 [Mesorhizobium ventifaucium]
MQRLPIGKGLSSGSGSLSGRCPSRIVQPALPSAAQSRLALPVRLLLRYGVLYLLPGYYNEC